MLRLSLSLRTRVMRPKLYGKKMVVIKGSAASKATFKPWSVARVMRERPNFQPN